MRKSGVTLLIAGCLCILAFALLNQRPAKVRASRLAVLTQTYIAADVRTPVAVPRLITSDGEVFAPNRLQGHWSVIFFGFTACPLVCPKTLAILAAVARDPQSGVSSGATQLVFVSIDPAQDTPARMRSYLQHFGGHMLGLTGSRDAIDSFSRETGAGSQVVGASIDHSTSLFVLDQKGRQAGILLRPNDPARIVADLAILRHLPS